MTLRIFCLFFFGQLLIRSPGAADRRILQKHHSGNLSSCRPYCSQNVQPMANSPDPFRDAGQQQTPSNGNVPTALQCSPFILPRRILFSFAYSAAPQQLLAQQTNNNYEFISYTSFFSSAPPSAIGRNSVLQCCVSVASPPSGAG